MLGYLIEIAHFPMLHKHSQVLPNECNSSKCPVRRALFGDPRSGFSTHWQKIGCVSMCEARKHVGYWDIGCTMLMAEIRPTTSDSLLPYLHHAIFYATSWVSPYGIMGSQVTGGFLEIPKNSVNSHSFLGRVPMLLREGRTWHTKLEKVWTVTPPKTFHLRG